MLHFHIMNKAKLSLYIVLGIILLAGVIFFVAGSLKPKLGGIYIETTPTSSVWIDGKQVGRTPYRETLRPSDIIIRLIPDSFDVPLTPYETKVSLTAGVETVVRYSFGDTPDTSAGDIISFERNPGSEISLVAVSDPDSAQLTIDGLEKAFTPHKTSALTAGEHELKFSLTGYQDRIVNVKTHEGYKLTAIVKLTKLAEVAEPNVASTEAQTASEEVKVQVEILSTPTGFLRVRSEASTLADEVGQVSPGEKYNLISTDEKTGWYEVEFEIGKSGWISSQYAKKIEAGLSITPTPKVPTTLTPTPRPTPSP
jgi:hypothetical protein